MRRSSKVQSFEKLTKEERNEVVFDLIYALSNCKKIEDAALFIEDLLTQSELEFISRRLRIAKLLLEGSTYGEIRDKLKVSESTISKIAAWLTQKGDGFRNIVKTLPTTKEKQKDPFDQSSWSSVKRKYPAYFLPELLIEEIVVAASKRQKKRLLAVVEELDDSLKQKSQLHKEIETILREKS